MWRRKTTRNFKIKSSYLVEMSSVNTRKIWDFTCSSQDKKMKNLKYKGWINLKSFRYNLKIIRIMNKNLHFCNQMAMDKILVIREEIIIWVQRLLSDQFSSSRNLSFADVRMARYMCTTPKPYKRKAFTKWRAQNIIIKKQSQ